MSKVEILQENGLTFVRKSGNVGRNLERLEDRKSTRLNSSHT